MAISSTDAEFSAPVESPCVRLCTLDDNDICLGCYRSIDEICAWGGAGNDERRQILQAANKRRSALNRSA
jgi:predicted Fe-S protein YdhL (DUF1289 family)